MSLLNGKLSVRGNDRKKSGSGSIIIAPNGSVISNFSNGKASAKNSQNKANSISSAQKSDSIISKTRSETVPVKSSKCGSIVSGVSSQVVKRKKKRDAEASSLAARSMSASSLSRGSYDYGNLGQQSKSQSVMSIQLAGEIEVLKLEERNLILNTLKKVRQIQTRENRRKQNIMSKINEIKSKRPPFPIIDPKACYICYEKFWPIFSLKSRCYNCNILVCRNCIVKVKVGDICKECKSEIFFTGQLTSIFDRNNGDYGDDIDISTIEHLIVQTSELEKQRNIEIANCEAADDRSRSTGNQSNHSNRDDTISIKSKSGSIFSGTFWKLKKKNTLSNQIPYSTSRDEMDNAIERKSITSLNQIHYSLSRDETDNAIERRSVSSLNSSRRSPLRNEVIDEDDCNWPVTEGDQLDQTDSRMDYDRKSIASMAMRDHDREKEAIEVSGGLVNYGKIMIGLSYNYNKKEFSVIVKKCRDLYNVYGKDVSSNPYVEIVLLPEIAGEPVRMTQVKYANLNPVFNEQCKFKNMPFDELVARTVRVSVIHYEWAGKNIFLGQKLIELCHHTFDNASTISYDLEEKSPVTIPPSLSKYYGDITFSIKFTNKSDNATSKSKQDDRADQDSYFASAGSIKIWISQVNNLFSTKYNRLPDTYVSCCLIGKVPETNEKEKKKKHSENKKEFRKKTSIVTKSLNPIYNYDVTFPSIKFDELKSLGLEMTVWDKKMGLLKDVLLGGITMNIHRKNKTQNVTEEEVWKKMLEMPEVWIEATLILRTDI